MHKITAKEFTLSDFSVEHLRSNEGLDGIGSPLTLMQKTIKTLNYYRSKYVMADAKNPEQLKDYWWQLIQLLPSSYNQTRTVMLNYETLHNIYYSRNGHKLDEWKDFRRFICQEKNIPLSFLVTEIDPISHTQSTVTNSVDNTVVNSVSLTNSFRQHNYGLDDKLEAFGNVLHNDDDPFKGF